MASEIRVDKITSLSGVGTITPSPTGIEISGITTVATLKATTGIVTTLTATTGIVTTLTANTVTSLGAVSGTTGTFTGDVDIADTIVHTGDTNTKIRFPSADIISFENGAGGETARFSATNQFSVGTTADVDGVNVAIGGSVRLVNATGQSATISALPSGTYNTGVSGGSAIVFHRFSDAGGGSDEIAFETHHQGTRHGEAARFNKSGNLVFPSGQGIDFTATGDGGTVGSELFDDYEEGAFTPTSNATLSTAAGFYTKKGREVTLHIRVTVASQSSNSPFEVSGFPFTSGMSGTTSNGAVPNGFGYISSGSVIPQIHHIHNGTKAQFYNFNNFMSISNVSGKEYRFGLIYYST